MLKAEVEMDASQIVNKMLDSSRLKVKFELKFSNPMEKKMKQK